MPGILDFTSKNFLDSGIRITLHSLESCCKKIINFGLGTVRTERVNRPSDTLKNKNTCRKAVIPVSWLWSGQQNPPG